jgi:hypothetical protein
MLLAAALFAAMPAHAGVNLVTNGTFSSVTMSSGGAVQSYQMYSSNNTASYATVTGWTSAGYNFFFLNGAGGTGAYSPEYSNTLSLWTSTNGGDVSNSWTGGTPDGNNFIGGDGAYQVGAISQTLTGLKIGGSYQLTFNYAGAQQSGYTGATTEGWQVTFGSTVQSTQTLSNVSHGFTGWYAQTMNFTATASSQTLSFLAFGTPSGEPPFSLLDSVSMQDIAEPGSLALLCCGLAGLIVLRRRPAR